MAHEQLESMRRSCRKVAKMGSMSLLHQTGQFIREWMVPENFQLGIIMIGVAMCVPTAISPILLYRLQDSDSGCFSVSVDTLAAKELCGVGTDAKCGPKTPGYDATRG